MKKILFVFALAISVFNLSAQTPKLEPRWAFGPGSKPYLGTGTAERGLAFNPVTGHLILVTRSSGYHLQIIDSQAGDDLGELNKGDIAQPGQGTFLLSKVGVADDGAIYAANFGSIGSATPTFNIYRWANEEDPAPTIAYSGDPGEGNTQQWGTSFDVRGAGPNTQILAGSTGGGIAALFTTTDGVNFTSKKITTDANADVFSIAAVFGEGNSIWGKAVENTLTYLKFDPATGVASTFKRWGPTNFPSTIGPIEFDPVRHLLAGVNVTTPDASNLYDVSNTNNPPKFLDSRDLPTDNANSLYMGAIAFGTNMVFVLDSNNGLVAYDLNLNSPDAIVPTIVANPAKTQTVRVGRSAQFIVYADGATPLTYYWYFKPTQGDPETLIASATTATNRINNVQLSDAGFYSVVVSNSAGTARSLDAELVVDPTTAPEALVQAWNLPSGSRAYLTGSNNQRGLAYNPATKHLILVNRAGGLTIPILDAATGADVGTLNTTGISVGTFILNKIEVTDDGVIYGSNFGSTSSSVRFKIYRWENESAVPTVAYEGNPTAPTNLQWGNDMNLRGSGTNTQIIVPSQQNTVAIFTTTNGLSFDAHPIVTDAPSAGLLRGVAFDSGNRFWATAENNPLYRIVFDLDSNSGFMDQIWETGDLPMSITPIAVYPEQKLLAGLSIGTPDTVSLYDISTVESTGPILLQSIAFPTDVANTLFAGSLDFGGKRLFVLDTNNGITAYDLPLLPYLNVALNNGQITISWTAPGFTLQKATDLNNPAWTDVTVPTGQTSITVPATSGNAFYRLVK
jgi:hypothetical protein